MFRCVLIFFLAFSLLLSCSGNSDPEMPGGGNGDADSDADGDADYVGDADSDGVIETVCPDGANHPETCFCIRIGVVGIFDSNANDADKDVTAFVDWLNNDSSAIVTMVNASDKDKPTINKDFLSDYDVLLFLYQSSSLHSGWWSYGKDEADALKKWIRDGGGVISVTGFNGDRTAEEVAAINSILEPATGISYNNDSILGQCLPQECYCWGTIPFMSGFDVDHPISNRVTAVGSFLGSSINAPDGAQIVAKSDEGNLVVATELGEGRAVAIADEWPLFSRLWEDEIDPTTVPGYTDVEANLPNAACYDMENEYWLSIDRAFQVPQFWYNVIEWAAPENECFEIEHPLIIVE